MSATKLTEQESMWVTRLWSLTGRRGRLAEEKRDLEQIIAKRVADAQAEVANAFVAWAAKNEIAAPPLDWSWFGEIARRYSPLHVGHQPPAEESQP